MMIETVKQLIATLKPSLSFVELRAHSTDRYLEAVFLRPELLSCCETIRHALGSPVKDFGEPAKFEPHIEKVVDLLGGIRIEQCLFFAKGDQQAVAYAALWPWASDTDRITLKVGFLQLK